MDMCDTNDENAADDTKHVMIVMQIAKVMPLSIMKLTLTRIKKHHRFSYILLPSNLQGKPTSIQAYLSIVLKDPGNTNEQRVALYLASGTSHAFKDCAVRAFVAASFPTVKVSSFAGEYVDFTFEGDALPQFVELQKSNFRFAICIPPLTWALDNNKPHAPFRAKSASRNAILSGTAKLSFSGTV